MTCFLLRGLLLLGKAPILSMSVPSPFLILLGCQSKIKGGGLVIYDPWAKFIFIWYARELRGFSYFKRIAKTTSTKKGPAQPEISSVQSLS